MILKNDISKFINLFLMGFLLAACVEKKLTVHQPTAKGFAESCIKACEKIKMKYRFE
jgi:hypothetical protein